MTTQSFAVRRPGAASTLSNLSIRPPSPSNRPPPAIVTPTNPNQPRPLTTSPTHSTRSSSTQGNVGNGGLSETFRRGSFDTTRNGDGPPVPAKTDKRLPVPPWASPGKRGDSHGSGKGSYAGAYDNKLVSSTVSHLPPIPPLSPTPTGNSSSVSSQVFPHSRNYDFNHLHPNNASIRRPSSIPSPVSSSTGQASGGVIVLPDGTVLSSAGTGSTGENRTMAETMAHSSAGSPWNLLIMHALPVFGGATINTSIEELNGLCLTHINASSGRVPTSRLIAVLSSDLREFVGSGMLTFKAKFDNHDESKLVAKATEQWAFFWNQILPNLEGFLLPFTQIKDQLHSTTKSPIQIRHLLLTGFLINILQPILTRLVEIIALAPSSSPITSMHPSQLPHPTHGELQSILQMSLVLATQAKCSSFYPFRSAEENKEYDKQVRENVDALGKAVRWRMNAIKRKDEEMSATASQNNFAIIDEYGAPKDGNLAAPKRHSLHRGPSLSQSGRFRRRGWRASANMSQVYGEEPTPMGGPSRQNSEFGFLGSEQTSTWAAGVREEEDEDEDTTPGQSFAPITTTTTSSAAQRREYASYASTMTAETPSTYTNTYPASALTASTMRGNSNLVGRGEEDWGQYEQQTPQAGPGYPRRRQTSTSTESETTPTAAVPDIRRRDTGRF